MAPELLKNSEFNEKIDVYSFAIILWEILTFQPLFPEYGDSQGNLFLKHMTESNLRPQLPTNCPAPLSRLITSCWDENPANRPSFSQVSTFPSPLPSLSFASPPFPSLSFPSLPFPSLSHSFPSFHQDLSPLPNGSLFLLPPSLSSLFYHSILRGRGFYFSGQRDTISISLVVRGKS